MLGRDRRKVPSAGVIDGETLKLVEEKTSEVSAKYVLRIGLQIIVRC